MDAYDIFKKLTRGAKFKRQPIKKEDHTKQEVVTQIPTISIKTEEEPNDDSYDITLLGNIKAEQSKKRKRKQVSEDTRKVIHEQEVNRLRNKLKLNVVGKNVPEPITYFDELPIKTDLIDNIKSSGYKEPTIIQRQAMTVMLQRRQILACAPTGSGKTAAFLVPIIHHLGGPQRKGFRAVIICPTRELAKQTQRECVRLSIGYGFRIHIISKVEKAMSLYGPKSSQKFDILVTTPNRLCYLLKQEPPAISLSNVEWLIIDEADKLFEAGFCSFRDQLEQILQACTSKNRKIGMFSATFTPAVDEWCTENIKDLVRVTVGQKNSAAELVDQQLLFVGNEAGKLLAFRDIVRNGLTPPVLIFVQSKDRAQQLFSELIFDGINVDAIHADRTQTQRDNTVRAFREGKIWVLICTELMARGIDFKGVNLVINYDFPTTAISYIHRVGRAGRAGRPGKAVTFFTTDDTVNLRSIAHVIRQSGCEVPDYMLAIKKRSKRELKNLKTSAPHRDFINTTPAYQLKKIAKRGGLKKKPKTEQARNFKKKFKKKDQEY
ncbi:hypothetical protein RN001_014520 [Aquatica leii]|uniref:Probable ATP-dependent RNA helicase DDX52 n=1 Tax=Aquatica leii TaxID=1421715 RepID=A0AAN7S685_9COLE|nr:hypothetical protein RN001_014520 [Aquatica leii]